MRIHRSKLLITLALSCVLISGATAAYSNSTIVLSYESADGTTTVKGSGGTDPNAGGEPDVGQGGPHVVRTSMTQTRREGATVQTVNGSWVREYALSIRWARVIWTARYLGLTR